MKLLVLQHISCQFHIEVGTSLPRLLDEVKAHDAEMTRLARKLFARWLEQVVGAPSLPLSTR